MVHPLLVQYSKLKADHIVQISNLKAKHLDKKRRGLAVRSFIQACNKNLSAGTACKNKRLLNGELKPKPELTHNTELKYNKVLTELNYVKEWVTTKMPAIQF